MHTHPRPTARAAACDGAPSAATRRPHSRAQVVAYDPPPNPLSKHPLVREALEEEYRAKVEMRRKMGRGPPKKGQGKKKK